MHEGLLRQIAQLDEVCYVGAQHLGVQRFQLFRVFALELELHAILGLHDGWAARHE